MKKTLLVLALAAIMVFAFASTAFAKNAGSSAAVGDGYVSWTTAASVGSQYQGAANDAQASGPHANYTVSTVKCAVCHSVHGAPDNTWLLTKVTNGNGTNAGQVCAYCHGYGATAGAHIVAINQAGAGTNTPHSSICYTTCHAGVHGLHASSYSVLSTKLLRDGADTMIAAAIADPNTGMDSTYFNATPGVNLTKTQISMATGYVCGQPGCHTQSAFAVAKRGDAMNVQSRGGVAMTLSGHPVIATASDSFVAPAGSSLLSSMTVSAATGVKVAFKDANGCDTCHDLADGATTDGSAFPHNRNNTRLWMTKAADASGIGSTVVTDTDRPGIGLADAYTTVQDGVCLKCHVSSDGNSGVSKTF